MVKEKTYPTSCRDLTHSFHSEAPKKILLALPTSGVQPLTCCPRPGVHLMLTEIAHSCCKSCSGYIFELVRSTSFCLISRHFDLET